MLFIPYGRSLCSLNFFFLSTGLNSSDVIGIVVTELVIAVKLVELVQIAQLLQLVIAIVLNDDVAVDAKLEFTRSLTRLIIHYKEIIIIN